jgi:hypothetical protein
MQAADEQGGREVVQAATSEGAATECAKGGQYATVVRLIGF